MEKDTQTLSKTQGGLLLLPIAFGKGPVLLNQASPTKNYILGKLVQPGIASLDLTLTSDPKLEGYQVQIDPMDLQTFHLGPAEIMLTTKDGIIQKPITIDA